MNNTAKCYQYLCIIFALEVKGCVHPLRNVSLLWNDPHTYPNKSMLRSGVCNLIYISTMIPSKHTSGICYVLFTYPITIKA